MLTYIPQGHTARQSVLHQFPRCLGQQHLPTMSGTHDARRVMHIDTRVAFGTQGGLTRVQAHPDTHIYAFRPGVSSKSALRFDRCRNSLGGTSKHHEEGVSLRIDLVAMEG